MIIDTSAILAIFLDEAEREVFEDAIAGDPYPKVSAATYLEAGIVIDSGRDPSQSRILNDFLAAAEIEIAPVTAEQASIAREAYRDFGRDSGHPARLNFGDCFAYALAKASSEELLFKGDDFIHTDVQAVQT